MPEDTPARPAPAATAPVPPPPGGTAEDFVRDFLAAGGTMTRGAAAPA